MPRRPHAGRGQSLVEFALVLPVLLALLGGIVQFGFVFWAQNTLTQVVRDTGRWAATQQGCSITGSPPVDIAADANNVASNSSLLGYSSTTPWNATNVSDATLSSAGDSQVAAFSVVGVAVAWVADTDPGGNPVKDCPPPDNTYVYHVTIKINHNVPVFIPGLQYLPGLGTCDATGCHIMLSSTAQYRMEPAP